ncbi:MAG: endonuclease NucS [Candidatus Micrarchaeia archaeon]
MDFEQAAALVNRAVSQNKTLIAVGKCVVKYEGRAASKISEGDRVLLIKSDGAFLVHQSTKMTAINYQGPGALIESKVVPEGLVVSASRRKPVKEGIEVTFSKIDFIQSFDLKDDKKLKVFGSERQLSNLLMDDLHLIEPGLTPLKSESPLSKGVIDILAEDKNKSLVVIEVKRRSAHLDAVSQLGRYVKEVGKRKNCKVRGIIVAPSISPSALKMAEKDGLEYFKLDFEVSNPSAKIKGLQKKQKILGEY